MTLSHGSMPMLTFTGFIGMNYKIVFHNYIQSINQEFLPQKAKHVPIYLSKENYNITNGIAICHNNIHSRLGTLRLTQNQRE